MKINSNIPQKTICNSYINNHAVGMKSSMNPSSSVLGFHGRELRFFAFAHKPTEMPMKKETRLTLFTCANDPNRRKCEEANKIIAKPDDKGGLIGFRTSDPLPPVEEGFEIWASSVAPTLKNWIN